MPDGRNKPAPSGVSGEVGRVCTEAAFAGNARKWAYSGLRCLNISYYYSPWEPASYDIGKVNIIKNSNLCVAGRLSPCEFPKNYKMLPLAWAYLVACILSEYPAISNGQVDKSCVVKQQSLSVVQFGE